MDSDELAFRVARAEALVSELQTRLNVLRRELALAMKILRRRKSRPVLLVVDPAGEVNVYGDAIEVAVAYLPHGDWRGSSYSLVERYMEATLPDVFAVLLYPSKWQAVARFACCPTVGSLIDRALTQGLHETLGGK